MSSASRSRMALAYSARFRRCMRRPPGTRVGGRRAIERRFEIGDEAIEPCRLRARHARRRHHAGAHLADHLLPGFRGRGHGANVHVLQRQFAGFHAIVVTGDAVGLQQCAVILRRRCGCGRRTASRRARLRRNRRLRGRRSSGRRWGLGRADGAGKKCGQYHARAEQKHPDQSRLQKWAPSVSWPKIITLRGAGI